MVWESLLGALTDAVNAVLGVVYSLVPPVPDFLDQANLDEVRDAVGGLSKWLPVEFAFAVATAVLSAYLTAGFIGIGRSFVSHFTGGGGAS